MPYKPSVHLIGIGGIGMSAIARWFLAKNWAVSGSDIVDSEILHELKKEGIKVKIGHKKVNLPPQADLVIYTQAVSLQNKELSEAKQRCIPSFSYPQVVGALTRAYTTIAVAGAHGKSTTTALVSLILQRAGLNPTVLIGTKLREFGNKNFRAGRMYTPNPQSAILNPCYLVLEADEYNRAFLHYSPAYAIITNVDREHLDTYPTLTSVKRAFLEFISNVREGGTLVLNRDDKNLHSLRSEVRRIVKAKNIRVVWYSLFSQSRELENVIRNTNIPGIHNASNSLAAYTLTTEALGVKKSIALAAIGAYRGSWRRMEYRGKFKVQSSKFKVSVDVYDDYAHHPTEIRATLAAFQELARVYRTPRTLLARRSLFADGNLEPRTFVICVFQPHQALRLKLLFRDFTHAFLDADAVILLPLYRVAGRDKSKSESRFTSYTLAAAIQKKYPSKKVIYLPQPRRIRDAVVSILSSLSFLPFPLVIMMGAGDIVKYTPLLLRGKSR